MNFVYPVTFTPDSDGGFVVTFRDWPEAITQGETRDQALEEAADCLEEAVAGRIDDRGEIPSPSAPLADEATVAVPIATALKAALCVAVREAGIGTVRPRSPHPTRATTATPTVACWRPCARWPSRVAAV